MVVGRDDDNIYHRRNLLGGKCLSGFCQQQLCFSTIFIKKVNIVRYTRHDCLVNEPRGPYAYTF